MLRYADDTEAALELLQVTLLRYPADQHPGFGERAEAQERVLTELGVEQTAFSKRRGIPIEDMCSSEAEYQRLRRFRAGAEGCISFLKRALGLRRCLWKGPQGFRAYVWGSVLAANLLLLARHLL